MATFLRKIYEVLSCFSTATHTSMCNDLLQQLIKGKSKKDNLVRHFVDALEENKTISHIERPFIPESRGNKTGRNPVASVMANSSPLKIRISPETNYEFSFLNREIPHLRAITRKEQTDKGWIDYVAMTASRPVLGEIKWKGDKNPFYAFVQLLTYLSEIATPNQIKRSIDHRLFGRDIMAISAFELHIFLANFNDKGGKGPLIEQTRLLASAFKNRLHSDFPETANCLGNVLCISARIEGKSNSFVETKCQWMV